MAQLLRKDAAKIEDLTSILRTQIVEGKNLLFKVVLTLRVSTHTHTHVTFFKRTKPRQIAKGGLKF